MTKTQSAGAMGLEGREGLAPVALSHFSRACRSTSSLASHTRLASPTTHSPAKKGSTK